MIGLTDVSSGFRWPRPGVCRQGHLVVLGPAGAAVGVELSEGGGAAETLLAEVPHGGQDAGRGGFGGPVRGQFERLRVLEGHGSVLGLVAIIDREALLRGCRAGEVATNSDEDPELAGGSRLPCRSVTRWTTGR